MAPAAAPTPAPMRAPFPAPYPVPAPTAAPAPPPTAAPVAVPHPLTVSASSDPAITVRMLVRCIVLASGFRPGSKDGVRKCDGVGGGVAPAADAPAPMPPVPRDGRFGPAASCGPGRASGCC